MRTFQLLDNSPGCCLSRRVRSLAAIACTTFLLAGFLLAGFAPAAQVPGQPPLICEHGGGLGCPVCQAGGWHMHGPAIGGDAHRDTSFNYGEASPNFVLWGTQWPQARDGDPVSLTYSYNNLLDGGLLDPDGEPLPVDLIRGSVEEALWLWASVAPLHFVEVEDQGGPVPFGDYPDGQFGQIRFHHRYINGPDIPGQSPTVKAQAFFPARSGNHAGDVYFDNGDPWQEMGELSKPDILGAAIHELGHALGLAHTDISAANMYWIFTRFQGLGTGALHPDDVAGIQAIYGAEVGSVTPLRTIPEPASWLIAVSVLLVRALGLRSY